MHTVAVLCQKDSSTQHIAHSTQHKACSKRHRAHSTPASEGQVNRWKRRVFKYSSESVPFVSYHFSTTQNEENESLLPAFSPKPPPPPPLYHPPPSHRRPYLYGFVLLNRNQQKAARDQNANGINEKRRLKEEPQKFIEPNMKMHSEQVSITYTYPLVPNQPKPTQTKTQT